MNSRFATNGKKQLIDCTRPTMFPPLQVVSVPRRVKARREINLMPPASRAPTNPWPEWSRIYGTDYGHAEVRAVSGEDPRKYGVFTKAFKGNADGHVTAVVTQQASLCPETNRLVPVAGSEQEIPADLVLFSMGFVHPEQTVAQQLGLDVDQRLNILAPYGDFQTSVEGVFAAGDCRRGQSSVVWAINEGRGVADAVKKYFGFQPEVAHRYG
jgi:NADPH-dependent glutamate synthase beta subunit-like oxidoreductase